MAWNLVRAVAEMAAGGTVLGLGFLVALVLCAGFMLLPGVAVWGVRETWRMLVGG